VLDKVFSNRYRLTEKLGIGGMAEVYKATDEVLGRTVAVKVMLPQYASDETFAARFKQEAQAAANLASPYIVNIYDWGYDEADGSYFIVMEYIRGTDLKTAIQQRGTINQRKVAEIGSQVCAALSVAHGYDIIHRDIKPHNIMVQPDGNAKVMDFGIARASGSSMTQTGSVLGTAYYVSPEQAQGKTLTSTTDLYSLGIVMYEAVTGKVPFDAPDAVSVALKQVREAPVPPSKINPNIDAELESIILRAMDKNPLRRYATADQMRTALNNYLGGRPIDKGVEQPAEKTRVLNPSALPVIKKDGAQPPIHTAVMPSVSELQKTFNVHSSSRVREMEEKRRRRRMVITGIIITVVLLAAIGIGVYAILSNTDNRVEVPHVLSMTEEDAEYDIVKAGLVVGSRDYQFSESIDKGCVIKTDPKYRTKVEKGTAVNLIISSGKEPPKKVEVPSLIGLTQGEAEDKLTEVGLKFRRINNLFSSEIEIDRVCAQSIEPGTEVFEGTTVDFNISMGRETGFVPNVVGAKAADAEAKLVSDGFVVAYADKEYSYDFAEGLVMKQSPISGQAYKGDTVTLTVSRGPKPISMPSMIGKTEAEVRAELNRDYPKMIPVFWKEDATEISQLNRIIRQDPAPGSEVSFDAVVTFYYGVVPASTVP